ncbi:von Willebrand factor A domain-containing protein 8 isoform X2 [Zootermopsis nevadensis]|uniref:von Willebrand factor A domain-containing protein 8 isoform X2 n=1 Tax=Zootermopsis nevadensis TaxID=136037 RepID=UPI000B8E26C6|nr:von Willebrand factor A domain-containing protein 8 isoform X2 [Zootermopsis nevadensis]
MKANGSNNTQKEASMHINKPTTRRIAVLCRILQNSFMPQQNTVSIRQHNKSYSGEYRVTIGDVTKEVKPARNPQFVPLNYLNKELSQECLQHLRWMMQKDLLGQDIFLIGRPGPLRRQLTMQYLEMTGRELEYVALSRDTTEADLKQRREIQNGTAKYFDQSAVRAAVEGRILVLEGIEKAERNVLPILNNLLENREMHLEDGRFLIPASRYDKLLKEYSKEELDQWHLVRVSEDFRVIALGIPVPRYLGNPLDPPLRSRFQARDISGHTFKEQLEELRQSAPSVDPAQISQLLSCCYSLLSPESSSLGLPDFPVDRLPAAVTLMETLPSLPPFEVLYRLYPYKIFLPREGKQSVEDLLCTFHLKTLTKHSSSSIQNVIPSSQDQTAQVRINYNGQQAQFQVVCGTGERASSSTGFIETSYQEQLLAQLLQSHLVGDFCIIGPRGCGKSATVNRLAALLNYQIEPIVLYQDMTSRDLVQQRTTLPNGDTVWQNSPLVTAALEGKMAVLDGIHRIHPSTLAVIQRLVHDRELQLHDGRRLVRHDRFDEYKTRHNLSEQQLHDSGLLRIHPAFRIVALAEPPIQGSIAGQWLSAEILSLFLFHEMRPLALHEEIHIVKSLYGQVGQPLASVMELAHKLRESEDPTIQSLAGSLSTRQLLRIARRMAMYETESPAAAIHRACLARFLPTLARQALDRVLNDGGVSIVAEPSDPTLKVCEVQGNVVRIGNTTAPRYQTSATSKVPDVLFFDVPQHISALEWLLQDFLLGEHLLLVGNQGVGKNKLADRLLQLLNHPREYIQLHRDTTVQTLTLQPTVRDGVVVYEDSQLVQAVKHGHVLIVDEADKAPTHVTCILKTLVESGEMILSDGRRLVPHSDPRVGTNSASIIPVHPDFRMIILANRPGFPFLGNDFFGALGDLFSCHAVDNPSPESELSLLEQYGPNVSGKIILKLVKAFGELRNMADQGLVHYPYSTREVVNIVKHLQEFPNESLASVVRNVFDFDSYSKEVLEILMQTLHKHGIPFGADPSNVNLAKELPLPLVQLAGGWTIMHSLPPTQLAVEERFLKMKEAHILKQNNHPLDKVEARAAVFSEMQSYWSIPIKETAFVVGLAVSKGTGTDLLEDWIHVLTMNPLTLYTMKPSGAIIQELSLQGLITPVRGARPYFVLSPLDNGDRMLIHEETSNRLIVVDLTARRANQIPLLSTFRSATEGFARTMGTEVGNWHMMTDMLDQTNSVILYEIGGSKVEVVNVRTMTAMSFSLPFHISSINLPSINKWLIEDTVNKKYVLSKVSPTDPCPSMLQPIGDTCSNSLGYIVTCDSENLPFDMLSDALGQKLSAPNRILCTDNTYAAVAVGFPELDQTENELYVWPRPAKHRGRPYTAIILRDCGQVVCPVSSAQVPKELISSDKIQPAVSGYLEITDIVNQKLRYLPVPQPFSVSSVTPWLYSQLPLNLAAGSNQGLVTVDSGGCVRLWETSLFSLEKSMMEWRQMIGSDRKYLQVTVDRPSGLDVTKPKHGKVDETGAPHVGGNMWAGGTGGRDTAGLGGKGGPYRLDAGHKVHQVTQAEKDAVPEHVKKAAREMGQRAFKQRLREIQMSEYDAQLYAQFSDAVSRQVQALRVILNSLQAKSRERQWMRHQTVGELDDTKLIEGLTGEKTIYRRRAEKDPEVGTPQTKPKRLKLVIDVSGSMYRFNSYDGRLDREMEAVVLVMEAFQGHEGRIQYDIVGHSGESHDVTFVDHKNPPTDNKQRLDIIKTMHAHSQYCMSGDNTLEATQYAIASLSQEDCDEAIVVILSDANLERYGIPPESLARAMNSNPRVSVYAIFIGSLGDQASRSPQFGNKLDPLYM